MKSGVREGGRERRAGEGTLRKEEEEGGFRRVGM